MGNQAGSIIKPVMEKSCYDRFVTLILGFLLLPVSVFSQVGITYGEKIEQVKTNAEWKTGSTSALKQLEDISGGKVNVPRANGPTRVNPNTAATVTRAAAAAAARQSMNNMVVGTIFSSLLSSMLS
jgi:hypothetical protein